MTYGFNGGSDKSNAGRYGGSSSNTASTAPGNTSASSGGSTSSNAGRYGGSSSNTASSSTASSGGRHVGGAGSSASNFSGGKSRSGSPTGSTSGKSTGGGGGGSTASNAGRYGGPTSNVASTSGARATTPAVSAGSAAYGGPSTATPTSYSPDLSSRTRMGGVTFGGPKATTTGLDQSAISDRIASAFGTPQSTISSRIASAFGTPTGTPTYNDANFNARTPAVTANTPTGFDAAIDSTRRGWRATEDASVAGLDLDAAMKSLDEPKALDPRISWRATEDISMADLGSLKKSYRVAIAGRETEGEDDPYSTIHSNVPMKDGTIANALGKYGVMSYNVGPWTKEVLGVAMKPSDFLADPVAQDKVFDAKIGQYVSKYKGDFEKAAQAWYGGEGSVGKPNAGPRKGVAGPTVGVYAQDALARQTNAYASLKDQNRTTQVAGTDPSSDVESRANEAGRKARADVQAAAEAAGEDPMSREVQQRGDIAQNEAYDAVKNGTPTTAAQDEPTDPSYPAQTQPAPAQPTTQANVSLPQRAPKPTSRDAPPYQRSALGYLKAAGIDLGLTPLGPIGWAIQGGSLLLTGDTVGGNAADAMGGKFGENYASPERNTPMRGLGSGGDRFAQEQPTSTIPKALQSPGSTLASTPAATFEEKYLGGSSSFDDTGRPTPEQKWDWTSSKYIGVANAPSV